MQSTVGRGYRRRCGEEAGLRLYAELQHEDPIGADGTNQDAV